MIRRRKKLTQQVFGFLDTIFTFSIYLNWMILKQILFSFFNFIFLVQILFHVVKFFCTVSSIFQFLYFILQCFCILNSCIQALFTAEPGGWCCKLNCLLQLFFRVHLCCCSKITVNQNIRFYQEKKITQQVFGFLDTI